MHMSFKCYLLRRYVHKIDMKRNNQIPEPHGVTSFRNLRYMKGHGRWHKLDVYRPTNTKGPLPLLVVVHGGGWIYGDKEIYHLYAKDLARRGFAVICFNYVLAPEEKFPCQLTELDMVLSWSLDNATKYGFDVSSIFLVGDSAGAQLSAQYAAIATNPEYRKLFSLQIRARIRGLGLNCGLYCKLGTKYKEEQGSADMWNWYLGKHRDPNNPHYDLLPYIIKDFPPSYVFTGEKDFIKDMNKPLIDRLKEVGVKYVFKEYTSKEGNKLQHVFHCTVNEEHAIEANDDECAFFRSLIVK